LPASHWKEKVEKKRDSIASAVFCCSIVFLRNIDQLPHAARKKMAPVSYVSRSNNKKAMLFPPVASQPEEA